MSWPRALERFFWNSELHRCSVLSLPPLAATSVGTGDKRMNLDSYGALIRGWLTFGVFLAALVAQLVVVSTLAPSLLEQMFPITFVLTAILVTWLARGWIKKGPR